MSRHQQIYDEFNLFLMEIKDIDLKMLEYGISFKLKMSGFQIMYLRTLQNAKELEEAQKKEIAEAKIAIASGKPFIMTETNKAHV